MRPGRTRRRRDAARQKDQIPMTMSSITLVTGGYSFLTVEDVLALPDPEWIVHEVIPADCVGQLFGPSGTGKSFVALDIGLSVATGRPWAGRPVRNGRVLYVASEGVSGYKKRIRAWMEHHGFGSEDLADFRLVDDAIQLGDQYQVDEFIRRARAQFDGQPISFIVFDTQANCTVGVEENSNSDMSLVMHRVGRIRRETGATPLLVHHTGRVGSGDRGASSVPAALTFQVSQKSDGRFHVRLECLKQKDFEEFEDIELHLIKVADSLVPVSWDTSPNIRLQIQEERLTPKNQEALRVLREQFPEGARHAQWQEAAIEAGVSRSGFNEGLKILRDADLIRKGDDGIYLAITESDSLESEAERASPEIVQKSTHPLGGGLLDSDAVGFGGGPDTSVQERIEDALEDSRHD